MKHFHPLDFRLSDSLIRATRQLQWYSLPLTTKFGGFSFALGAWRSKFLWDFLQYHRCNITNIGTIELRRLPIDIESDIRKSIVPLLGSHMVKKAIIRLQIVYGGQGIPVHIDPTRSAGVVYPLSHDHDSWTEFYQTSDMSNRRGIINPRSCVMIESVNITHQPVLLDLDQPHAVVYDKNAYSKQSPRISLSIKFENVTFTELLDHATLRQS